MNFYSAMPGILFGICSALTMNRLLRKEGTRLPCAIGYLLGLLPFLAGGFYTYLAALTSVFLLTVLLKTAYSNRQLKISVNWNTFTFVAIFLGYCITPFWAADQGMAVFGILRFLPVLLSVLLLMQYSNEDKTQFLSLLPIGGAVMTIAGCILWYIPAARDLVTVNGRLSGFLQYPNTFAAFLLTGLATLGAKPQRKRGDWLLGLILTLGIFLSGSRAGILLLSLLALTIAVLRKRLPLAVPLLLTAAAIISAGILIKNGTQITFLGRDIGSFFIRILYYKDAVPVILRHPFGLGYLGYRALETTFQTSRYTVSFVHSGLLQMLLDIGWFPALLFAVTVIRTIFSSGIGPERKTVLLILSAHAAVDFDLQFLLFWVVLLMCLDFENGKEFEIRTGKLTCTVVFVSLLAICVWLGLGDWFYQTGEHQKARKLVPFHTDALAAELMQTADPEDLEQLADRILTLNSSHALAYSAKANAAYARGQIPKMIQYKEEAIRLTPYATEEYCDYIQKLYTVLELYIRNGDTESAAYCLRKLLSVPDMIDALTAKTDPLAYKTGNNTELILPESYRILLAELRNANPEY